MKVGSIDGTDIEPHDKGIIRAISSNYYPNKHVKGKPECTIFVSRLNLKTTKDTIRETFSKYGRIKRLRLVKDIVTGYSKGYAFVEFELETDAEEAYQRAHKTSIDCNVIFIDFECERLLKGWKPRRLGGGFGGKKESGQLRFGCRDRPFIKPIQLKIKEESGSKYGRLRNCGKNQNCNEQKSTKRDRIVEVDRYKEEKKFRTDRSKSKES